MNSAPFFGSVRELRELKALVGAEPVEGPVACGERGSKEERGGRHFVLGTCDDDEAVQLRRRWVERM